MPTFAPSTIAGTPSAPLRAEYQAPASFAPSDAIDVPLYAGLPCVGVRASGAGNINVDLIGGGAALLTVLAGQIVDVGVKRIRATSTTATGIVPLHAEAG